MIFLCIDVVGREWKLVTLGTCGSLDSKDISMWGGGGREGGLDILLLLTLWKHNYYFCWACQSYENIAFLFGIRLIYKKLLRKVVFYIIYSTLITY